jgi:hypothetical protein
MCAARTKMMTSDEIQAELGWSREMISTLLKEPDSNGIRRNRSAGSYTRGLYKRDRVLAVAQTPETMAAKRRWDETVRGCDPAPGWTMRLGGIGQELEITARAVGKILDLMGFRSHRQPTDLAIADGCGSRRWDGDRFHIDWHPERVVEAIRLAASCSDKPEIADAISADVARQEAKEALAARRRQKEEAEAAHRRRREAEMNVLEAELAVLMAGDPDMCLLDAVELVTYDPGERLALYRALMEFEQNAGATCASRHSFTRAIDLVLLERRAAAEGFVAR